MINLLLSGNDKVADGLLIVVLSYIKNNKEPVTVYFQTMDLTEINKNFKPLSPKKADYINAILKSYSPESSLKVIDMKPIFTSYMKKNANIHSVYTPYATLRLFADLDKQIPDKFLYLDTDIIIGSDISSLYDTSLENREFAAALDMMGHFWISYNYQNSGVMLMNMALIRKTGLLEKCRKYILKVRSFLPDQDALNKYVQNKLIIPRKYNEQGNLKEDTIIKHFAKTIIWLPFPHIRNIKPWQVDEVHKVLKIHEYDDVLEAYLKAKKEIGE